MSGFKVLIVDDSPFSRTILGDVLREGGCEVVGEADSLDSLLETYSICKPDIVTMDIAMPGADGFECSKALRRHDPAAKIILVSSMKDDETEAEAKRIGVMGYVQKPVDGETLTRVINAVMSPDALYQSLGTSGMEIFIEALSQSVTRMTKTTVACLEQEASAAQYLSLGITVVIGIIGKYPGSMVLDLSVESAEKMAEVLLRRPAKSRDEVVAMAAEFANVVAGVACSMLNKKDKAFGLRVAPPSVFYGASTEVISPNIEVRGVCADTDFGRLYMSVGFKKGSVLWM
ncbi:MAG: response regulator [Negativicutes bacterium]|nr:response regulator [Negativicutes bacterium]